MAIEEQRRRRYVDAAAEILHEFGRAGLTSTSIVQVAGTARTSFYGTFSGIEACFDYAIELADAELFAALDDLRGDVAWALDLHRAIEGFYRAVASQPLLAELLLMHSSAARSDAGRKAYWSVGERFVPLLADGRPKEVEGSGRRPPSRRIEQSLSRSIVSLAARRVRMRELASLPEEAASMTALVGGFYFDPEQVAEMLAAQVAA